jgi:hypothetical protein
LPTTIVRICHDRSTVRAMASSSATTVTKYLASLPADRRAVIAAVRDLVNANLPDGYVEGMQYGMIGWYVPLSVYPDTYNGQPLGVAALAAQKHYNALYLMAVYGDPHTAQWFEKAFAAAGKKLDMGKSCVRFKTVEALPLDVIAETIRMIPVDQFLAKYESVKGPENKPKSARAIRDSNTPKAKTARPKAKAKNPTGTRAKAKVKKRR